jgi:predicted KAP-like P-loop ATPase
LSRRFEEEDRFEILKNAVSESDSLSTIVHDVSLLRQQNDSTRSTVEELLTPEHVDVLEGIALEKIRAAAADGTLLDLRRLLSVLYRWREWGDGEEPKAWVSTVTKERRQLVDFLMHTRSRTIRHGGGSPVSQVIMEVRIDQIEPFFDLIELSSRASSALTESTDLTDEEREMLNQVIEQISKHEPENPDLS